MRPGTSAIVGRRPSSMPRSMTPRFGSSVVNGYAAILGRAAVSAASSVDLPALGRPTRPTSAISRSSRRTSRSSPGSPRCACLGAWWVEVAKWTLPRPPRPPRAIMTSWPTPTRSAISSPVARSMTPVPGGTARYRSSPDLPCRLARSPRPPGGRGEVVLVAEVVECGLARHRRGGTRSRLDRRRRRRARPAERGPPDASWTRRRRRHRRALRCGHHRGTSAALSHGLRRGPPGGTRARGTAAG